jgi:hypothetical protein
MTDSELGSDKTELSRPGQETGPGKQKPYHKPEFRAEKTFETTALTCGKVQVTQPQCHHNRKLS